MKKSCENCKWRNIARHIPYCIVARCQEGFDYHCWEAKEK